MKGKLLWNSSTLRTCSQQIKRDKESWGKLLDGQHLFDKKSDELPEVIHDIVLAHVDEAESVNTVTITEEGIAW